MTSYITNNWRTIIVALTPLISVKMYDKTNSGILKVLVSFICSACVLGISEALYWSKSQAAGKTFNYKTTLGYSAAVASVTLIYLLAILITYEIGFIEAYVLLSSILGALIACAVTGVVYRGLESLV